MYVLDILTRGHLVDPSLTAELFHYDMIRENFIDSYICMALMSSSLQYQGISYYFHIPRCNIRYIPIG